MANASMQVPYRDAVSDSSGLLSTVWQKFFEAIKSLLDPLGAERTFALVNNTAVAADITGLTFDSTKTKQAIIEYFVQRVTTSVELHETGTLHAIYQQNSGWAIFQAASYNDDAGITFTIAADGQVKYTTSNVAGTQSVSRINFRARTLAGS